MKRGIRFTLLTLLALTLLALQPLPSQTPSLRLAGGNAQAQSNRQIFLPLVRGPVGAPVFAISSPAANSILSRTAFFAVQASDPQSVVAVSFKAGSTSLGSDSNAADGFRIALDARTLPAGPLQLTATATGPGGATASQTIDVTVVPNPPSSGVASSQGAVVASAIGSTIMVPPGGLPPGASISVSEKTQQQTTSENGIDWDALGVTFLGAQQLNASATLSGPLTVASAGFGGRVQPGQTVVNYRLAPDADGDGAGELVVVNTASVAPNNDVISDPVPQITLAAPRRLLRSGTAQPFPASGITGAPGTTIAFDAAGLNTISTQGNLAIYRASDGTTAEVPAFIHPTQTSSLGQVVMTAIPLLPAGPATLTLRNQSSGSLSQVISLTIEAATAPSGVAGTIIDQALATNVQVLNQVATLSPGGDPSRAALIAQAISQTNALRTLFQGIAAAPTPTQAAALNQIASAIERSNAALTLPAALQEIRPQDICSGDSLGALGVLLGSGGVLAGLLIGIGSSSSALAALGIAAASGGTLIVAGALIGAAVVGVGLAAGLGCLLLPPNCPAPQAGGGGGTTGMGSAPPPGGNGCGSVVGGSGGGAQTLATIQASLAPGRYLIKILSRDKSRSLTPFTGLSDVGGYFFIPLIPQGEPFTAIATDRLTGASASYDGVGPATGQSTYLFFDFSQAQSNVFNIAVGDTVSNGMPGPGAGNIETPTGLDIYLFNATAGQQIYFDLQNNPADSALVQLNWRLVAPDDSVLFDSIFNCCGGSDPGVVTATLGGTYSIRVGGDTDPVTGTYSFKIWNVPPPQRFTIAVGDTVSNGNPGAGAGNIETPGVRDVYTFSATAGQQIFVDLQNNPADSALVQLNWQLIAPDDTVLFNSIFNCCGGSDPGVITATQAGNYTIIVGEDREDAVGSYSFKLWNVPPPQQFSIAVGDTVSNGVPGAGAGNIETPGVRDIYTFNATAGQQVVFDLQNNPADSALVQLNWQLIAPDGTELFDRIFNCCGGSDPGTLTLPQSGSYTIIVGEDREEATGTYAFQIRAP